MEVRVDAKDGAQVLSPSQVVDRLAKQLQVDQQKWVCQLSEDPSSFAELEVSVHHTLQQLGDQLVASLLAEATQASPALEAGEKKVVAAAPERLRSPEKRPLKLRLLGGLVVWIATMYCGPAVRSGQRRGREGSGLYPELSVLGISEGSSPALASQVGRLTALLPSYEVARKELAEQGVPLDIKVVHRIARQVGAEMLTTRRRDLERYRAGDLPAGRAFAGKRVGVAIDGGRTRLRTVIRKQKGRGKAREGRAVFQAALARARERLHLRG